MMLDPSEASRIATHLVHSLGHEGAHRAIDMLLSKLSAVEVAAMESYWPMWARPKQLPPKGEWDTWGFLCGRGFGKTLAISKYINGEALSGRAKLIGITAQDEANSVAIQVLGPSGLIATAPVRLKPVWEASRLELFWPSSGARAYVRTPEVPGKIRGLEYHLSWMSEIQDWPKDKRAEAYSNFVISTRVGYSRLVWDATPRRRHPILKELLEAGTRDPSRNFVVRGSTHEAAEYLGPGYVEKLEAKYGGTQKGKEELYGEMLGDEDAIFRQEWFDATRRGLPDRYKRRARYHDPAITSDPRHSDSTGIFDMGLGFDGQIYAIRNHSGKHRAETWATESIDAYVRDGLDLLWVETNRGGDSHAALLRVVARSKGLELRELAKDEEPVRRPGIVNFRGVNTKRQKVVRAEGAATLCEKKRVTMAKGLEDFEAKLCAFDGSEGGADDDIDAFVHGCHDLAGMSADKTDPRASFRGLTEANAAIQRGARPGGSIASLLGGGNGGRI